MHELDAKITTSMENTRSILILYIFFLFDTQGRPYEGDALLPYELTYKIPIYKLFPFVLLAEILFYF